MSILGTLNSGLDAIGSYVGDAIGAAGDAIYGATVGNDDSTLSQSQYDFSYKIFPNDLGMDYLGHYMVININVPVYPTGGARGSGTITSQFDTLTGEYSKVDVLRFGNVNSGSASAGGGILPRRTRRIAQSIALYMPGTQLIYGSRNMYEEISLTALGGQILSGIASTGAGVIYGLATRNIGSGLEAASGAGNIINSAGQGIGTAAQLAGSPINPRVEVLFANTQLRDFQFEFLMMPRNQEEARTIREIIKTLRFHAAPEVVNAGFTFVPPAEFDITFYHRGSENMNIPRINTCVLVECEADYAPGLGVWQTHRDGSPVAVRLRLVFKEVEIVHKLRVLQGF